MPDQNYADVLTLRNLQITQGFPTFLEKILGSVLEKESEKSEVGPCLTNLAGRPRGPRSLFKRCGQARHYDAFVAGTTTLNHRAIGIVCDTIVSPALGTTVANELRSAHRAYFRVNDALNTKNIPYRAPRSLSRDTVESTLHAELGGRDELIKLTTDPKAFYDGVIVKIQGLAASNHQSRGIKLADSVVRVLFDERIQRLDHLDDYAFSAIVSSTARIGGWTAQHVGQMDWFSKFLAITESQSKTGDRTAIFCYYMLKSLSQTLSIYQTGRPVDSRNYASDAIEAILSLPPGALGYTQEYDAPIFMNAAGMLMLTNQGLSSRPRKNHDGTALDYIDHAIRLDEAAYGALDPSNRVSMMAHKARGYAADGAIQKAYDVLDETTASFQKLHVSHRSRYSELNLSMATAYVKAVSGDKTANDELIKAQNCAIALGDTTRLKFILSGLGLN
ncbi:hypothetical protein [Jiella avicenniae]|uniref:Uncharacterized protein n=1 Tax=Jiella avicenniae TaxID=2907202 RepID=A0A9X1T6R7_9HYPH|nr:hypothetical protein [Jiella avicenniae]MCE7030926.1 hypothetical protein [Jiella avicenniae]